MDLFSNSGNLRKNNNIFENFQQFDKIKESQANINFANFDFNDFSHCNSKENISQNVKNPNI